jgi:hypothetical protein
MTDETNGSNPAGPWDQMMEGARTLNAAAKVSVAGFEKTSPSGSKR